VSDKTVSDKSAPDNSAPDNSAPDKSAPEQSGTAAGSRADDAQRIAAGYAFAGDALAFGSVVLDGTAYPQAQVRVPLAMILFGMINWTFTWLRPDGKLTYEDMAPVVSEIFLSGVQPAAGTRRKPARQASTPRNANTNRGA